MAQRKIFGGIAAFAVGLASGAIFCLIAQFDLCENAILDSAPSPGGQWLAVAFARDCGATTSASINISILSLQDVPRGTGNIFVSEGRGVKLAWQNSSALEVVYPSGDRVFREQKEYSGITIGYSTRLP